MTEWFLSNIAEIALWFCLWQVLAFLYEHFLKFLEKKSRKEHDEDI